MQGAPESGLYKMKKTVKEEKVGSTAGRKPVNPREGRGFELAAYLNANWGELAKGRTNEDISLALGYNSPNIPSMLKMGKTTIALDRIPLLAEVLNMETGLALKLWLAQHIKNSDRFETAYPALEERIVSERELEILREIRRAGIDKVTLETHNAIRAVVKNTKAREAALSVEK
jgi:hypothetical protein